MPLDAATTHAVRAMLDSEHACSGGVGSSNSDHVSMDPSPRSSSWDDLETRTMIAAQERTREYEVSRPQHLDGNPFTALGRTAQANSQSITISTEDLGTPQQRYFWAIHERDLDELIRVVTLIGVDLSSGLRAYEFPSQGPLFETHLGWPYSNLDGCEYGDTGLHVALRSGTRGAAIDHRVVQFLLERGVRPDLANSKSQTALQLSQQCKCAVSQALFQGPGV